MTIARAGISGGTFFIPIEYPRPEAGSAFFPSNARDRKLGRPGNGRPYESFHCSGRPRRHLFTVYSSLFTLYLSLILDALYDHTRAYCPDVRGIRRAYPVKGHV